MNKLFFKISVYLLLITIAPSLFAQSIGMNSTGATPSANAVLDLNTGNSNNQGLIIPNVTLGAALTTFNPPIANAATTKDMGMIVYNSIATNQPIGYYYWNGTTWVGISAGCSGWSLTGNAGTTPGTNFIGTKDAEPLEFEVNGQPSGYIDYTSPGNLYLGYKSGNIGTSTGIVNVGFGYNALSANTSGSYNTALGAYASYLNTTGLYNTAVGYQALHTNTTGSSNTAVGYAALVQSTGTNNTGIGVNALNGASGNNNTAVGGLALMETTTGDENTVIGASAMMQNTTGNENTGMGESVLYTNSTGNTNTAIGLDAIEHNTTGNNNAGIGAYALNYNSTGSSNVALGYSSGSNNGSGNWNTYIGYEAGVSNTSLSNQIYLGDSIGAGAPIAVKFAGALEPYYSSNYQAGITGQVLTSQGTGVSPQWTSIGGSGWSLTGNAGTTPGTNFIGTTDTATLVFRVNNNRSGWIDDNPKLSNTFFGYQSGKNTISGVFGRSSVSYNTGVGFQALYNNTFGVLNTATGYEALYSNTTGGENTATGFQALSLSTNGFFNTASGYSTLHSNTIGSNNTAFGSSALYGNATGSSSTALGYYAGFNSTASWNTFMGDSAGNNNTTGIYNTFLGYNATANIGTYTNATAIGANSSVPSSNMVVLGNANVTQLGFNGAIEPYYSSAYQAGTTGQVLTSQGAGVAPQWTTPSSGSSGWSLTGNAGTTPGTNFIGTTDAQDLVFKVDNTPAGIIDMPLNNTSLGFNSLLSITTGTGNTGIGRGSLKNITTGTNNTAVGYGTLNLNVSGYYNTAIGQNALNGATGSDNTGIGYATLASVSTGVNNAVGGAFSGALTTTASCNTFFGFDVGYNNNGSFNTFIGDSTGTYNTTGQNNMFVGYGSGTTNTTGTLNTLLGYNTNVASNNLTNTTAIGANSTADSNNSIILGNHSVIRTGFNGALEPYYSSAYHAGAAGQVLTSQGSGVAPQWTTPNSGNSGWSLAGNAGTTPGTNFIGTNDANALEFKVNGQKAGYIDYSINFQNSFYGFEAGNSNTGNSNIAFGYGALLKNTTGNANTATGSNALGSNITGNENTAIGAAALFANTSSNNTSVGYYACGSNTSGTNNSSLGNGSLLNNTTGSGNTAMGYYAGQKTLSSFNVAIGDSSLITNTTGTLNTALGYDANVSSNNLTNATAIGANSVATASNMVVLGNTSVTQLGFNGALEPYYSSAYQSGTSGQVLTSEGVGVAPQWTTVNTGANYLTDTVGGLGSKPSLITAKILLTDTVNANNYLVGNAYMKSYFSINSANYLHDTVGGNGSITQLVTKQTIRTDTSNSNGFLVGNAYMKSYVATHSGSGTYVTLIDSNGGSGITPQFVTKQGIRTDTAHANAFLVGNPYMVSYFNTHSTNYLIDTSGGAGSKPVLVTTKLLKTDTTNANNYLVGNAYMKSYVANNSANYLNDTISGSGSKPALVTKKYIASYVTLIDSNGGSGITPQFVTKQGIRTDTTNANSFIVGNAYMKSYVATHTTNYLADTSGGAGSKPALLSKNSGWTTIGNTGTTTGTNFIGTNDAKALEFKVDAQKAGWIDYTSPYNTSFGFEAGNAITTGIGNTANGYLALASDIIGSSNSALGRYAGYNTTKSWNTFVGDSAGYNNTTGTYNTYLGYAAGTASGFAAVSNTTCLGHTSGVSATTIASNAIYLGNNSITKIYGEVTSISSYSDRRIKDNIEENVPGLAFITKLHPVTYHINLNKENTLLGVKDDQNWEGKYDIEKITQSGFIAQQVDSAAQSCGYDFNGLNKPSTPNGLYSLGYTDFVVPLVKAVQELSTKNDSLTIENNQLKEQIYQLKQLAQKQDERSTNDEKAIAELKALLIPMNQAQASIK